MHSDSAVLTGSGHSRVAEPAQDYALHRDLGEMSWGIVADGCSSAGRTDIGSRLWALGLDNLWRQSAPEACAGLHAGLLRKIAPRPPMGVEADDLQATLVAAWGTATEAIGFIAGDGALIAVKENGERLVVEHRFSANLPAYPVYLTDPVATALFISRSRAERQVLEIVKTRYDGEGQVLSREVQELPIEDDLHYAIQRYDFALERPLKALLAVTDGFCSRPRVEVQDTLMDLATVVNPTGQLLKRRLGLLGQRWAKSQTWPKDDLSVAGVCWS